MVITLHFCELAPQLLQLLVYLRSSSALPINFTKRAALGLGRTGGGLIDGRTPLVKFGAEMLSAFGLLQLQFIHLPGQRLTPRSACGVRTPLLFKLSSKALNSDLQFSGFALCGLYLGLQGSASLLSLLQLCLGTLGFGPGFHA